MPTKRSAAKKKAIRTRKLKSAGEKATRTWELTAGAKAAKLGKLEAPARKAVATEKLRAAAEAPPTRAGE